MKVFGTNWLLILVAILGVNGIISSAAIAGDEEVKPNRMTNDVTPSDGTRSLFSDEL